MVLYSHVFYAFVYAFYPNWNRRIYVQYSQNGCFAEEAMIMRFQADSGAILAFSRCCEVLKSGWHFVNDILNIWHDR